MKSRQKKTLTPKMEEAKWKPGQSGNPNGRPLKERYLPAIFEDVGSSPVPEEFYRAMRPEAAAALTAELLAVFKSEQVPIAKAFAYMEWRRALTGNDEARRNVCNLLSGKFHKLIGLEVGEEDGVTDTRKFLRMIFETELNSRHG